MTDLQNTAKQKPSPNKGQSEKKTNTTTCSALWDSNNQSNMCEARLGGKGTEKIFREIIATKSYKLEKNKNPQGFLW